MHHPRKMKSDKTFRGAAENWHYRWKHLRLIESEKTVKIGHVRYQMTRHKFGNQKMMSIRLSGSIVLYRTTPLP